VCSLERCSRLSMLEVRRRPHRNTTSQSQGTLEWAGTTSGRRRILPEGGIFLFDHLRACLGSSLQQHNCTLLARMVSLTRGSWRSEQRMCEWKLTQLTPHPRRLRYSTGSVAG